MLKAKSTHTGCKEALQPGNIEGVFRDFLPLKVLLIVDSTYWVIGHFAKQVKMRNEAINFSVCSAFALKQVIKRFGPPALPFDLLHYLSGKPIECYGKSLPTATTAIQKKDKRIPQE